GPVRAQRRRPSGHRWPCRANPRRVPVRAQRRRPSCADRSARAVAFAAAMAKIRLDTLLAERGVFASRSRAAASVLAGEVLLGEERRRAEKPGQLVPEDVVVAVAARDDYVSRGGRKLANALDAFGLAVAGRRALDVGASTGGFTDCLLQRGAEHVVALDV